MGRLRHALRVVLGGQVLAKALGGVAWPDSVHLGTAVKAACTLCKGHVEEKKHLFSTVSQDGGFCCGYSRSLCTRTRECAPRRNAPAILTHTMIIQGTAANSDDVFLGGLIVFTLC